MVRTLILLGTTPAVIRNRGLVAIGCWDEWIADPLGHSTPARYWWDVLIAIQAVTATALGKYSLAIFRS